MDPEQEVELGRLEDAIKAAIKAGETGTVLARHASGAYMLTLKKGKQLPPGVLAAHCAKYGVKKSELSARMKLAAKYPTPEEVSTVMETYPTWTAIKKYALPDKPRAPRTGSSDVRRPSGAPSGSAGYRRADALLEDFDYDSITTDEAKKLIVKYSDAIVRLKATVALMQEAA